MSNLTYAGLIYEGSYRFQQIEIPSFSEVNGKRSGTVKFQGAAPLLEAFLAPLRAEGQLGGPSLPAISDFGQPVFTNEYCGYSVSPDPVWPSVDLKFDSESNDFRKRANDSTVQVSSEITVNLTVPFSIRGTISAQYVASQTEYVWVSKTKPKPNEPLFSGVSGTFNPWEHLVSITFQPDGDSLIPSQEQMLVLLQSIGVKNRIDGYNTREIDTGKRWECSCVSTRVFNV